MKRFLVIASLLCGSVLARGAAELPASMIPDCSAPPFSGSYLVTVDAHKLSTDQLLLVLQQARTRNLEPISFPYVFAAQSFLYFETKPVDHNVQKLSPQALQRRIYRDLQPLTEIPGVGLTCATAH